MTKTGMANKNSDGPPENRSIREIVSDLQRRSEKSLKMAKETVFGIRTECREINEAFKHYARNWNDYVHPGLVSIACEAVGGNPDEALPMQVVMLMLTAAADIHDDIIDESKTKYGKPTVFGRFGKDVALLVGDAFLVKALTMLHELKNRFSEEKINKFWNIISGGFFELGEAEALEASWKGNTNVSPEECLRILEKKASTFEAHMRIGALIGGGNSDDVDMLGNYGRTLGVLFGIREDFIDMFEPDELENRMKRECLPLPILYASANPHVKKTLLSYLSKQRISIEDAENIVDLVYGEKSVKAFRNEIKRIASEASLNISKLKNKSLTTHLQTLLTNAIKEL